MMRRGVSRVLIRFRLLKPLGIIHFAQYYEVIYDANRYNEGTIGVVGDINISDEVVGNIMQELTLTEGTEADLDELEKEN